MYDTNYPGPRGVEFGPIGRRAGSVSARSLHVSQVVFVECTRLKLALIDHPCCFVEGRETTPYSVSPFEA